MFPSVYLQKKGLIGSKVEHSSFEGANSPYCKPVYVDAEVQTHLI